MDKTDSLVETQEQSDRLQATFVDKMVCYSDCRDELYAETRAMVACVSLPFGPSHPIEGGKRKKHVWLFFELLVCSLTMPIHGKMCFQPSPPSP